MEKLNKTKLRIELDKTIQAVQFEPLKVQVSLEEDIVWESVEERQEKIEDHRDRMIQDFIDTFNIAVRAVGENGRCIGRIQASKKTIEKAQNKKNLKGTSKLEESLKLDDKKEEEEEDFEW
jgi:hypothetical protein